MILAASAAIKTGTKYLQVFTEEEYAHTLPIILPQIIAKPFSLSDFENSMSSFNRILIGPGTTTSVKKYVDDCTRKYQFIRFLNYRCRSIDVY
jgi:NAD(P)H-hydrate repair Nnr-like enzyme with NAD(P)H-hydrate dehydratase domain